MKRKIKIGLDFDGVVAYNPFRVIRYPVAWFKKKVLKKKGLSFFIPKTWWQKGVWMIIHGVSIFPALGSARVIEMSRSGRFEFHLITGRLGFLGRQTEGWLEEYGLRKSFASININTDCHQPHLFKEKLMKNLKLDYYVEDNLDVVEYIKNKGKAKVLWVYNIVDRGWKYENKFPSLKSALEYVEKNHPV